MIGERYNYLLKSDTAIEITNLDALTYHDRRYAINCQEAETELGWHQPLHLTNASQLPLARIRATWTG